MSQHVATLQVPNHLHKFIIGTKGATIKNIQVLSGDPNLKISCSGDQVTISSVNAKSLDSAKQQVLDIYNEHKSKIDLSKLTHVKEINVPNKIHKYVIGDKGAAVKQIEQDTTSQITFNGDKITIKSASAQSLDSAHQRCLTQLRTYGWFFENNQWVERNFTDQVFGKYREKVTKEHELMAQCYENAQKAFTAGKKDEAKKLSEQGKKHQEQRDKFQKEAAEQIFKEMNKDVKEDTIDLHGLFVAEAVEFVEARLEKLTKERKVKTFYVITGAGNHSAESAKIKPEISKLLEKRKLAFTKGNDGVFVVSL